MKVIRVLAGEGKGQTENVAIIFEQSLPGEHHSTRIKDARNLFDALDKNMGSVTLNELHRLLSIRSVEIARK